MIAEWNILSSTWCQIHSSDKNTCHKRLYHTQNNSFVSIILLSLYPCLFLVSWYGYSYSTPNKRFAAQSSASSIFASSQYLLTLSSSHLSWSIPILSRSSWASLSRLWVLTCSFIFLFDVSIHACSSCVIVIIPIRTISRPRRRKLNENSCLSAWASFCEPASTWTTHATLLNVSHRNSRTNDRAELSGRSRWSTILWIKPSSRWYFAASSCNHCDDNSSSRKYIPMSIFTFVRMSSNCE